MEKESVKVQIEKGKEFFKRKYPEMKYLAYFQSYTNTHGKNIDAIRALYEEALDCDDVVGLVIGTRPDTLPDNVLDILEELSSASTVFLEIGAETANDHTLRLINRHHTWHDVEDAVQRASSRNIHCGLHLIAGLPGEDDNRILGNVEKACALPIDTLKLHQLQILKDTPLCRQWETGEIDIKPFELDEYLSLCAKIIDIVPPHIVIERFLSQSPPDMVVAPKWGLKNYQFMNLLDRIISEGKR